MIAVTKSGGGSAARVPANWGLLLLAVSAALGIGIATGLGLSTAVLVAVALAPFLLLFMFARPQWAVPIYVVLVYADLLSVMATYQGLPPVARFVGGAVLAAVLGYRLILRRQPLVLDEMAWWLAAYGVMLAAGLLYARDRDVVMTNIIEFIRNIITFVIILNITTTPARLRRVLWAVLAMGVVLALISIFQSLTGRWDLDFSGLGQARSSDIVNGVEAFRPGGTVGDANYYGLNLLILIPFAMYLAFEGRTLLQRLLGVGAALVLIAAVIFTYSRGDALAVIVMLAAVVLYKRFNPIYVVGILIVVALSLPILPANYTARLTTIVATAQSDQQTIYNEESIRGRAGAAQSAILMFLDHPLIGVGRENYPLYELQYLEQTDLALRAKGIAPHDLYLEVLAEHGLMGLVVVGGIFIMTWRAVFEARRRFRAVGDRAHAELAAWLGIGLLGYMVGSLFLHGAYLYQFWLQVALIIALRQLSRATSPEAAHSAKEFTYGGFKGDGAGVSPDRRTQSPRRFIHRTHYREPGSF
jgi:putative inorganic carbon (hco3(-)) transporter